MQHIISVAVPKGRLLSPVEKLINSAGYPFTVREKKYEYKISNGPYTLLVHIYKNRDIPMLVARGICDIGFAGSDWIQETGVSLRKEFVTEIGKVKLVAAVHESWNKKSFAKKRITCATEYVNLARNFFEKLGIPVKIVKTHGASESYIPCLADIIIDTYETGKSLKENNLVVWKKLFDSTVWFVTNPRLRESKKILLEGLSQKICQVLITNS